MHRRRAKDPYFAVTEYHAPYYYLMPSLLVNYSMNTAISGERGRKPLELLWHDGKDMKS